MKVQWYMDPPAAQWADAMAHIAGCSTGRFIERLIKYHAGELADPEHHVFEELLDVGANSLCIEFDPNEEPDPRDRW